MIDAMQTSLAGFLDPTVLLMLGIGIFIGYFAGILPGLGGIVTLALLLPFTLALEPFAAIALLLGMFSVVTISGDLTAILIGIPGSPPSAPLVLDGYSMSKQGRAMLAMSTAVLCSGVGAVLGGIVLFLTIPVMRPLILAIGSPRLFMLTLLGLAMVASLSSKSMLKGIGAAALGVLIGSVGPVAVSSPPRYTFGQLYLLDGFALLPLVIGIFAIPELMWLHRSGGSIAQGKAGAAAVVEATAASRESVWGGWTHMVQRRWLVLRSSLIGAAIGAIPGLGGSVAAWMAYGHASNSTKDDSTPFGEGNIDGVIGPASANNSKEGGGLIPTIAFGVPGTAGMAVLLGAFIMMGIQPGPSMVTRHLDLTYFMVWVLLIANLLGMFLTLATIRPLAKVTKIKGTLMVPFIVIFVLMGSTADTGQTGDLLSVLGFGLLAFVMTSLGWPIVPFLLGYILVDRMERSLWISFQTAGWQWMIDPVVLGLAAVIAFMIYSAYRNNRMHRAEAGRGSIAAVPDWAARGGPWSLTFSLSLVALCGWAFWYSTRWIPQARLIPMLACAVVALTAIVVLMLDVRHARAVRGSHVASDGSEIRKSEAEGPAPGVGGPEAVDLTGLLAGTAPVPERSNWGIVAYLLAFGVAVWLVGLTFAVGPMVVVYYRLYAKQSWFASLGTGLAVSVAYWFFDWSLSVPAVRGVLL